jgi:RNA recognition motif-containing protein
MIKNVPGNYNRELLLELVDSAGFAERYDFVYCPKDFKKGASLGYAFVNMLSANDAQNIISCLDGYRWKHYTGHKVCEMAYGDPLQGREEYIGRYRNSPVMHESVPDDYKPVLFANGHQMPLPPPTKRISPPRQWKQFAAAA